MFDIGFWEILLIGVLALVVIGPERLPGAARQVGFFVGKARRYIEGVRNEVASELDIDEFKRVLHNQEVQINELQQQLKSGIADVKSELPSSDFLTDSHPIDNEIGSESGSGLDESVDSNIDTITREEDTDTQSSNAESGSTAQTEELTTNKKKKVNKH